MWDGQSDSFCISFFGNLYAIAHDIVRNAVTIAKTVFMMDKKN